MADQVDEVKQKTDIVSLIGEYVQLKKAGRSVTLISIGEPPPFADIPGLTGYQVNADIAWNVIGKVSLGKPDETS